MLNAFLLGLFQFFLINNQSASEFNKGVAELIARQYFDYLELCSKENNSFEYRTLILNDLCEDPQITVMSDLPNSIGVMTVMNDYLNNINKIPKDNYFSIDYNQNIQFSTCRKGLETFWGCSTKKTITSGKNIKIFNEVLEISVIDGAYKISSIRSDIIREFDFSCTNIIQESDVSCKLVDLAELELSENKIELAVAHLEESKSCGTQYDEHKFDAIKKLNLDSIYKASFNKGVKLYQQEEYTEALVYFTSISNSYSAIQQDFKFNLSEKIKECNMNITLITNIEQGDFQFKQNNIQKAISYYREAEKIKSTTYLLDQIRKCEEIIKQDYLRGSKIEIESIERLMKSGIRGQAEGFRITMKYRYTGLLSGKHFFFAAQVAEDPPGDIRREFELYGKTQCMMRRQMLLNAWNLGYDTEDFHIYWDEYLTPKNRTCE